MSAFLEVTTVAKCMNECKYCPQDLFVSMYREGLPVLSFGNFKKAINKLPPGSTVSFAGYSEPALNPYFVDMVLYAHEKGHSISVFTTLIGLSIENYMKIKHINYIYWSIHLPDSEGKTVLPITEQYTNVLQYVINNLPQGNIILQHHAGELHEGVKDIVPHSSVIIPHDRSGNVDNSEKRITSHKNNIGHLKCGHCFLFNYNDGAGVLVPTGDIYVCSNDFGLKHKLGNIFNQSWDEIMHGEEMRNIFEGLMDDGSRILCRACAMARSEQ